MSMLARGDKFELLVYQCMKPLVERVSIVGGKLDSGIDLEGVMISHVPFVVQCKSSLKKRGGPQYVRELEGVISSHPGAIGILAHSLGFTSHCVAAATMSNHPIILAVVNDKAAFDLLRLNPATTRVHPQLSVGASRQAGTYSLIYGGSPLKSHQ